MMKILWRIEGAALAVLGGICTVNMILSRDLHLPVWVAVLFFIGAGLCFQCSVMDLRSTRSADRQHEETAARDFQVFDHRKDWEEEE